MFGDDVMLKIENLSTSIDGKDILKNFYLNINDGEVHALMGPNGTGKSTLSKVILNNKKYKKLSGKIMFDDVDITNMSTDEIARKGIFLCNQLPCEIDGVTTADFLRTALNEKEEVSLYQYIKKIDSAVKDLKMDENMIHRSMNKGFSGGEKKKNEILQLKVLEPKFIILDELDSGLDVDSLKIVCENINSYLKEHENTSVLIITHYPKILQYIKPDYVHVMVNGNIKKTGDASLALEIEEKGYDAYKNSASIVSE
jgi:Fe-S cluster assembly ATP-binding protein